MSNTSTVSPYESAIQDEAVDDRTPLAAEAATVVQLLLGEDPDSRAQRRSLQERKVRQARRRLRTARLHLQDSKLLLSSLELQGYRPLSCAGVGTTTLLANSGGERLSLAREGSRVVLRSLAPAATLERVVQFHALEAVRQHLRTLGQEAITSSPSAGGEVRIQSVPPGGRVPAAASPKLTIDVRADGTTRVDVDGARGSECAGIVAGLAAAIGGRVTETHLKPAYFQGPGEPRRVKV